MHVFLPSAQYFFRLPNAGIVLSGIMVILYFIGIKEMVQRAERPTSGDKTLARAALTDKLQKCRETKHGQSAILVLIFLTNPFDEFTNLIICK